MLALFPKFGKIKKSYLIIVIASSISFTLANNIDNIKNIHNRNNRYHGVQKNLDLSNLNDENAQWFLAVKNLREKKYQQFRTHLSKTKKQFLLNLTLAEKLYNIAPKSEQKFLLNKITEAGFFEFKEKSTCPYYELDKREKRGKFIYQLAKNNKLPKVIKEKIIKELMTGLPEVMSASEIGKLKGAYSVASSFSIHEYVERINMLLLFGKNLSAKDTVQYGLKHLKKAQAKDIYELKYQDAKIERRLKNYTIARKKLKIIIASKEAAEDTKIKARYIDASIATILGDESSLPLFDEFIAKYPSHSFADDIMYFKASLLLGKNKKVESQKVIKKLIKTYPHGDMIEKTRLAYSLSLAKEGATRLSIEQFVKLFKTTDKGSLFNMAAKYWIARLSIFPKPYSLEKPKPNKKAVENLTELVNDSDITVYSLLAYALLNHMGHKVKINNQPVVYDLSYEQKHMDQDLLTIKNLLESGFKEEALLLLDDIETNKVTSEKLIIITKLYLALDDAPKAHHKLVRCNHILGQKIKAVDPHLFNAISYPCPFAKEIDSVNTRIDIPKNIILGIIRQESGFISGAKSWAGASGLMQLMYNSALPEAYKWGINDLSKEDLYITKINILLSSSLLSRYWKRFSHPALAIAAYNGGPTMVSRRIKKNSNIPIDIFIEEIPIKETKNYVKSVLGNAFSYGVIYKDMPLVNFTLYMAND